MSENPPDAVLEHWGLYDSKLSLVQYGHINRTYIVEHATTRFVLQRVNPIFGTEMHSDIRAVTGRLLQSGVPTPTLVLTDNGRLFVEHDGLWRLLTWAPGKTYLRVHSGEIAASAGALLARFHRALADFDYTFQNTRTGIHDTDKHLEALQTALDTHRNHANAARVEQLTAPLCARLEELPRFDGLPQRPVHGDPKISNVLFDESDRAHCLVDLDTLQRMSVCLELGDAMRSWCNVGDEDGAEAHFDAARFEAGMNAYIDGAGETFSSEERAAVLDATELIALELAARFAADALNESYFGWNPDAFASRSEHNLTRTQNQIALAASLREQRSDLERVLSR